MIARRLDGPGSQERLRAVRARFKRVSESIDRRQVLSSIQRCSIMVIAMFVVGFAAELFFVN